MDARFSVCLGASAPLVVAVSGGPDSMALCALMDFYAGVHGRKVHAITVNHNLRPESGEEARRVSELLAGHKNTEHHILHWTHDHKPQARLQEDARSARYALMGEAMQKLGVTHLFTAHHMDDQAETFLFRLAKGSGLDGLAGMQEMQEFEGGMTLCRPLLEVPKAALLEFCAARGIGFVTDPSNENTAFARVRLRGSMDVLEREGLTAKRLAVTASRLARARAALEEISARTYAAALLVEGGDEIILKMEELRGAPEEIGFRVVMMAIKALHQGGVYGVRTEKAEALFEDLMAPAPFRTRTLGGLIIRRGDKEGTVIFSRER